MISLCKKWCKNNLLKKVNFGFNILYFADRKCQQNTDQKYLYHTFLFSCVIYQNIFFKYST